MRIALDAMGSDNAPLPEVKGAVEACASGDLEVILVGDEARVRPALARYGPSNRISIVHASQAVTMDDSPVMAVRKKKDASLLVAIRLVKHGQADAVVSAGNTGAVMVAARTILAPITGVARSAICQLLPSTASPVLLIDLGANVDCSARHLCDFAEMGVVYSRQVLGVESPRVGLLNIGEEQVKGNELSKAVHRNLQATPHLNFIGNVEPGALYHGEADVVVCDGFVGNVVLKTSEATAGFVKALLEREYRANWVSRLGALLSLGVFRRLKQTVDANEHSGAPLLGVNGVVIILHGSCTSRGVTNAIRGAQRSAESQVNDHIRVGISELRSAEVQLSGPNGRSKG